MKDLNKIDTTYFINLYKKVYLFLRETMSLQEVSKLTSIIRQDDAIFNTEASFNQLTFSLETAIIAVEELRLKQATVCSILLFDALQASYISLEDVEKYFGNEIKVILQGLLKVHQLDSKKSDDKSDNYVKLILSFIQDVRVIFIVLAMRLQMIRK